MATVRSQIEKHLADTHANILRKDIEKIVDIIIFEIIEAVCRNEAVEIRGWGRIKAVSRKARIGRNPKNAKTIQIPAKKAVKWKMKKLAIQ